MLFSSFEFIIFLAVVYLLYLITSTLKINFKVDILGIKSQQLSSSVTPLTIIILCFSSIYFYNVWKSEYTIILLSSIIINYLFGFWIEKLTKYGKFLTILGVLFNVFLLAYFKYTFFIVENIQYIHSYGLDIQKLVLPLGISFFTFQQIAYIVDIYKRVGRCSTFPKYFLFVSFFPQLIAGPIIHHKKIIPQFDFMDQPASRSTNFAVGLYRFSIGLFKKVVFADTLANYVNYGFANSSEADIVISFIATMAYTLQLYFDFSGYCDMAVGTAKMFNIKIPENFLSPYKAVSIQDFWRKWHITLSNWLRDYIYIPLGGNRKGKNTAIINMFITFLIGGIWHGAGWTFILWGAMHGVASGIHKLWMRFGFKLHKTIAWLITFSFVHIAWIFFRAENYEQAIQMIKAYGVMPKNNIEGYIIPFLVIIILIVFCLVCPNAEQLQTKFEERLGLMRGGDKDVYSILTVSAFVALTGVTAILFMIANTTPNFLYFNF